MLIAAAALTIGALTLATSLIAKNVLAKNRSTSAAASDDLPAQPMPVTGSPVSLTSSDGFTYRIAMASASATASPSGQISASVDYVLTNTGTKPAFLGPPYPGDLFLPSTKLPDADRTACATRGVVEKPYCTPKTSSEVIARLGPSGRLIVDRGDRYLPAGGSYLIRVTATLNAGARISGDDLRLKIWQRRFDQDGRNIDVPVPRT
ncbi:hypothetical protein ACRYCC_34715 [Actinomadura scrupuli]|uniref:hypothetical protein n=1 Tax=Actinomadura scrupuli TaxID=559629 RepID=UPI003D98C4E7